MPHPSHYSKKPVELSPRELDVLRCAAYGLTVMQTAAKLGTHYETVRTQRKRAKEKLGAATFTGAVAMAVAFYL